MAAVLALLIARFYLHTTWYTGLIVFPDLKVVRILSDGPGRESGIQVGDRILSFADRSVENFEQYVRLLHDPEIAGHDVSVEVLRDGSRLRFPLTPIPYPLIHRSFGGPALGLVLLIFGVYVFFRKPDDPTSDLYLVLMVCLFIMLGLSNHLLRQAVMPLVLLLWGAALIVVVPVNLHFYLVFPEPKEAIRARPWLLLGIYAVPLGFLGVFVWTALELTWSMWRGSESSVGYARINQIIVAYFFVGFLSAIAAAVSVVHSLLKARSPETRKQIQVILVGATTTVLLAAPVIYGLSRFLTDPGAASRWPSWVFSGLYGLTVVTTALLPLSMAVAILKYRLWDVDTAINRSLIYMGVSAALLAIYFFIVGIVAWAFGEVARPSSHVAVLAFALTVALIGEPLRHLVKRGVDRTFNREAYLYRQTLSAFSRQIVSMRRLEELTQGLCETVSRALGARHASVVLEERRDDPGRYRKMAAVPKADPPGSGATSLGMEFTAAIIRWMGEPFAPHAVMGLQDPPTGAKEVLEALKGLGVRLVVPIGKADGLLGWILLGEKRSGAMYTGEDRELLEALANQAAVGVENARAFEEIDALYVDLQAKVTKVEEQRTEIMQLQERLLDENRYLKEEIGGEYDFTEIIGAAHGLSQVMGMVEKAAQSDATILLCGESGTGKELVARGIHHNSHLREGPFIRVNCAALPEGVLQSELFGHEKGAFTGAQERRLGRFELADGGTIFLDEIGEISPATQVMLLRVLQEQEFERVGGTRTIQVRVRVIAATNRDLERAVQQDRFRTDLYYRLKVITIELPPLRERGGDIVELSIHFVEKYAQKYGKPIRKIEDAVLDRFRAYAWPGNVRELENVIERAVVLSRGESLAMEDIPMELQMLDPSQDVSLAVQKRTGRGVGHRELVGEFERARLVDALDEAGGNKSQAARLLGLKRSTFYNKLRKYGLVTEDS